MSKSFHSQKSKQCLFSLNLFFFIEVWLTYNAILSSAISQSDSVTHVYILFHYDLS